MNDPLEALEAVCRETREGRERVDAGGAGLKSVVIVQDVGGYPRRVQALRDAHPWVVAVSPEDRRFPHTRSFEVPREWLPADESVPFARRCWFKADAMGLAAVMALGIDADFYWFIESDVVASQERWRALFADHEGSRVDCVSAPARMREATRGNKWWGHPGTPAWASCYFVMACYRLSRRAVEECTRCAEEMRECFAELAVASVVRRAGMTMGSVNARDRHWNVSTFKTKQEKVIMNPDLINHPCKADSHGPPGSGRYPWT